MPAILKLGPHKSGGPMGITSEGAEHTIMSPSLRSIMFKAGPVILIKDNTVIESGEVEANQRVLITLPTDLFPRKYDILISYNPKLLEYGSVSCPPIVSADDKTEILLHFHAGKKTNLNDLEYVFNLYMID